MRKQELTSEEKASIKEGLDKRAKAINILLKRERRRSLKALFLPWTRKNASLSRQKELDEILKAL